MDEILDGLKKPSSSHMKNIVLLYLGYLFLSFGCLTLYFLEIQLIHPELFIFLYVIGVPFISVWITAAVCYQQIKLHQGFVKTKTLIQYAISNLFPFNIVVILTFAVMLVLGRDEFGADTYYVLIILYLVGIISSLLSFFIAKGVQLQYFKKKWYTLAILGLVIIGLLSGLTVYIGMQMIS